MRHTLKPIVQAYLRLLTRIVVWRHRPDVIAVTGITNKTTTKNAIVERLRQRGLDVRANPKNFNTEIGLPLAVLYVEPADQSARAWIRALAQGTLIAFTGRRFPRVLVLEFGVSAPGDMRTLLGIIRPRVVVFTNVQPSYFNPTTSIDELAGELTILASAVPKNGLIVVNGDDPYLTAIKSKASARVVSYGVGEGTDVRATDVVRDATGERWEVGGQARRVDRFGEHQVYAALAAEALDRYYSPT